MLRWLLASERRTLAGLALLALVTRLPLLTYPKACDDEQVYTVVAVEMLHGGQPYASAVERKPPLLFYLYQGILQVAGERNYFALHLVALLWTIASMATIYRIGHRMFDAATGAAAALLYVVFLAWANYTNLALNGELLMNLPVLAAIAITFGPERAKGRPELLVAGLAVALAFLLKQPSAIAGLPLAIYLLHGDYRSKRGITRWGSLWECGLLGLGFSLGLLAAAWFLHTRGILAEAWYWTIANHANPFGPTTWFFWHKLPLVGAIFVAENLPLLIVAGLSLREERRRSGLWQTHRAEFAALVVLLAGSLLGVCANGQFNYHYFLQLTPSLALLAAPVLAAIWTGASRPASRFLQPGFLSCWLAATVVLFLVVDAIGLARNRGPLESAVYVREHSGESDRIFMWGQGTAQTGIYLDARRRPASRYIASFPLNGLVFGHFDASLDTRDRIVPGAWDNLAAEFARHPPKFIIDCHAVRDGPLLHRITEQPFMRELLASRYRLVKQTSDGLIYERTRDRLGE